jgi:hypothetical protein
VTTSGNMPIRTHRIEAATMQTLRTLGKADNDGVLHLAIPVGAANAEFEVVVVLQPRAREAATRTPEDLGWPPGFIEQTAGSIQDETFRRHD